MAQNRHVATAEDLLRMPDDGFRYELVRGELRRMSPAGYRHGAVAMRLAVLIAQHAKTHQLGQVVAAETGFVLARQPDLVRAPDVAFVARERLEGTELPTGFYPGAPDLAAEVVSPGDSFSKVQEKVRDWLGSGCRLVLVVEPEGRTVAVYTSPADGQLLAEDDVLEGGEVLPGFTVPVRDLFA